MSIIGYSFTNDLVSMMPVIARAAGEKSLEVLTMSPEEVMVVLIRRMNLWVGSMIGHYQELVFPLFDKIFPRESKVKIGQI